MIHITLTSYIHHHRTKDSRFQALCFITARTKGKGSIVTDALINKGTENTMTTTKQPGFAPAASPHAATAVHT
ncbi:hypothetical protein K4G96_22360, partial [Mycobacterium tuberculosis]|nr:hypothetical protein [Mycobacterium tuberculosis]